jgi:hypothetical protein
MLNNKHNLLHYDANIKYNKSCTVEHLTPQFADIYLEELRDFTKKKLVQKRVKFIDLMMAEYTRNM